MTRSDAYLDAADLHSEYALVLTLAATLHASPPAPEATRLLRLRTAALLDRIARAIPGDRHTSALAEDAARQLATGDYRAHRADRLPEDAREYAREQYAAYRASERTAAREQGWDLAEFRCGSCGSLASASTRTDYVLLVEGHPYVCTGRMQEKASGE